MASRSSRRVSPLWLLVAVAALAGAAPALASFDSGGAGASGTFGSRTMPTAPTISCTWGTSTSQVSFNWSALSNTYSWLDGLQLQRNADGGSYANQGSALAYNASSTTDSPASPSSHIYGYQLQTTSGTNWRTTSNAKNFSTCTNFIYTVASNATTTMVQGPEEVVTDSYGNVILTDTLNHCIRVVAAAAGTYYQQLMYPGKAYTVAGTCNTIGSSDTGAALSATMNNPNGLAIDSSNNLYIADTNNNKVVELAAGTSTLTAIAGTGTAGSTGDGAAATSALLDHPKGITVDSAGNVYIADTNTCKIRVVLANGGKIYSVAGNGTCGDTGVGAPATSFELNKPRGIATDSSGNVYVADTTNKKVRKLTCTANCNTSGTTAPTFTMSEFAGDGTSGTCTDGTTATAVGCSIGLTEDVATDSSGNVFIAATPGNYIEEVPIASGTYYGINMTLNKMYAVVGNGSTSYNGNGYGTPGNSAISSVPGRLSSPGGVWVAPGGAIYVADSSHNLIRVRTTSALASLINIAGNRTGGSSGSGTEGASAELQIPTGLAVDASGNVIIGDSNDHRIRKWFPTQVGGTWEVATIAGTGSGGASGNGGPAIQAAVSQPEGIAVDSNGVVYFADAGNARVRYIDTSGNMQILIGTGTNGVPTDGNTSVGEKINTPYAVAVDGQNNVYIASTGTDCSVYEVLNNSTSPVSQVWRVWGNGTCGSGASQLSNPQGMYAVGSTIYIADTGNHRIVQLTCSTNCSSASAKRTFTGSVIIGNGSSGAGNNVSATGAVLNSPTGVYVSGSNVYIADNANNRIAKVTPVTSGTITTFVGTTGSTGSTGDGAGIGSNGSIQAGAPFGVVGVSGGDLFFTEQGSNNVLRRVVGAG